MQQQQSSTHIADGQASSIIRALLYCRESTEVLRQKQVDRCDGMEARACKIAEVGRCTEQRAAAKVCNSTRPKKNLFSTLFVSSFSALALFRIFAIYSKLIHRRYNICEVNMLQRIRVKPTYMHTPAHCPFCPVCTKCVCVFRLQFCFFFSFVVS